MIISINNREIIIPLQRRKIMENIEDLFPNITDENLEKLKDVTDEDWNQFMEDEFSNLSDKTDICLNDGEICQLGECKTCPRGEKS
jgi:hypothetical protein